MNPVSVSEVIAAVLVFVTTFLLGSIPWGVIISRVFYHKDIRNEGSGNIGTTNAMRSLGKVGGAAVFVLDFGKGLLSGVVVMAVLGLIIPEGLPADAGLAYQDYLGLSLLGCAWGHIFSPWLKFKGGKGIAVAVGCLFVVFGVPGALLELSIFIVLVVLTRYVSVGSIAAAAACPFFALYYFWGYPLAWLFCTIGALTVVWAHRGNIERLRAGTERRIGDKKSSQTN